MNDIFKMTAKCMEWEVRPVAILITVWKQIYKGQTHIVRAWSVLLV